MIRLPLPGLVQLELVRFCALIPLSHMNFRLAFQPEVTASDASSQGGGICVSSSLTNFGRLASACTVRGEVPEEHDFCQVLSIGLFDGIGALRVACDALGLPMAGHVSIELSSLGRRVVESAFPDSLFLEDVALVGDEEVQQWACKYSNAAMVLIGAGPPCQGVSRLNSDRRGALRDHRSCLFAHVPRIKALVQKYFPWAQVRLLMESVASMDPEDRKVMSEAVGVLPWKINASDISLAHRPRLYWIDWELVNGAEADIAPPLDRDSWESYGEVKLQATVEPKHFLEEGWSPPEAGKFTTFTTARPAERPGRKPAGLSTCSLEEKQRWEADQHKFPPYQYKNVNCASSRLQGLRVASIKERECIMGFPINYTRSAFPKSQQGSLDHLNARLSLIGNSWNVGVVAWLLQHLFSVLGLTSPLTPTAIVQKLQPGSTGTLQHALLHPPLNSRQGKRFLLQGQGVLVQKLCGLVSVKGEDLLLQSATENLVKYQRLRTTVPASLWKWRTVAGWKWTGSPEHINALELRAVFTTIRWWAMRKKCHSARLIHLTDSLVCLHSLSRGRSSSRKLRRTLMRTNAYLLACNIHPAWAYVHTSLNPADRPSRRFVKKKWGK